MKRIDELRKAESPVLIERGRNQDVLIIAFTGFVHRLSLRVYEFFEATKDAGYSRPCQARNEGTAGFAPVVPYWQGGAKA